MPKSNKTIEDRHAERELFFWTAWEVLDLTAATLRLMRSTLLIVAAAVLLIEGHLPLLGP